MRLKEIILSRVYQEVKDFNSDRSRLFFKGIVQPEGSDAEADGFKLIRAKQRQIDWEPQFEKACEAFEKNQLLVFVDKKQAGSLEDTFHVSSETRISFLRLVVLVGG